MTKTDKTTDLGIDPIEIARYFVCEASNTGVLITPLKLQKLVYYAYTSCLSRKHLRLFTEKIEAWQNGPVIPSIYHALKEYGANPVSSEWGKCDTSRSRAWYDHIEEISEDLKRVNEKYGRLSAFDLVTLTHSEMPWENARAGLPPESSSTRYINDEDILKEYQY